MRRAFSRVCIALGLTLAGCGELPSEGPVLSDVQTVHNNSNSAGFLLIDLSAEVADHLKNQTPPSMNDKFGKGRPFTSSRIGVGDVISVQIWEADPGGLFSSAGSVNRGVVPNSTVDSSGRIMVPFAGSVRAAGRTTRQLSQLIARRLEKKTVDPQVHVSIVKNRANTVSVTGGVRKPSIVPLTNKGLDLLDVVATVGGSKFPSYASRVSLNRRGKIGTAYLSHLISSPSDNIYLKPGDKIHIEKVPQSFSAFGAVARKGKEDFGAAKLSVLEGIGKVSGLKDRQADPRGVFLLRFEKARTAYLLAKMPYDDRRKLVPVIYRIDLKNPNQYFFAQAIQLHDKDVIYVANAPSVELDKFLTIIGKGMGIGIRAYNTATP